MFTDVSGILKHGLNDNFFSMQTIPLALTYDDVLIVPRRSTLASRKEANTKTRLTKKLSINIPIVSANMDTVTESNMCIALARLGGIGILHRFMSIEDNVEEVRLVKRAQNFIIADPYAIASTETIGAAKKLCRKLGVSGLLVADGDRKLRGILTHRDLLFARNDDLSIEAVMTPREKIITGNRATTFGDAERTLAEHKIEKLPLVDESDTIVGLITAADMEHLIQYPQANIDANGQLVVGASVGVHGDYLERAQEMIKAGADLLVVDIAHGHSDLMFKAIKQLRVACPRAELMVGNIATTIAAEELCAEGVDALKVGVGPGTTCITRLVTGCGVPQLSAVMAVREVTKKYGVPMVADGGIQKSGDIVKAIGAGADTVMIGGLFAGVQESPGRVVVRGDKKFKVCRGSASFGVAERRKHLALENKDLSEVVPEGVESVVPYKGPLDELVGQLVGGLRSGMSYTDSRTIAELQQNTQFVRVTSAGRRESGAHDLTE